MNNQPRPEPQSFTLMDILNIRMALEQIKDPSSTITTAIAHLDKVISAMCHGFSIPTPAINHFNPHSN